MLGNFKLSATTQVEKVEDSLGGGSFILESAIWPFKIDIAYIDKNDYGNDTLNIRYTGIEGNKKSYRETIPFTENGQVEVKGTDGTVRPFYGFLKANAFLQVMIGKDINEVEHSPTKLKIYDFKAGGEVLVEREVLTELTGLPVRLGLTKNVNNKKMPDPANKGKWINNPDGSIKETNKTQTVFRFADLMTAAEILRDATEAKFHVKWIEKYEGTTQGKVEKIVGGMVAGAPGAPAAGGSIEFDT